MPAMQRERGKRRRKEILFNVVPLPALDADSLLTTHDLLSDIADDTAREQARAYLSHRVGDFLTHHAHPLRVGSPLAALAAGAVDGDKCGRVCWRGAFARQEAGDFVRCQPLDSVIRAANPRHGGMATSPGYLQVKRAGDGNHGRHSEERAKAGHLLLAELSGASGYSQINSTAPAPQHICARALGRDGKYYQCTDVAHLKKKIADGGAAVLLERLSFQVTVARYEANGDLTVVSEAGGIKLVGHPLSAIRAGHAAFALGSRLRHSLGVSNGPSVASLAASQPHGAISATFMISVASYTDAVTQLNIWRGVLQAHLPTTEYKPPPTCFYIVSDERMEAIRSSCELRGRFSIEESRAGGAPSAAHARLTGHDGGTPPTCHAIT